MSSGHVIRHPEFIDAAKRLRDLLRDDMPNARDGFVVLDVDVLVRWYGPNYGTDAIGRFAFLEVKYGEAGLGHGSAATARLIDRMLRSSPEAARYVGTFLVHDYGDRWRIHGTIAELTDAELTDALEDQLAGWPPLFTVGGR